MPAALALPTQRLVVVTGKGGVGKSTVALALARAAAGAGKRVLAVDVSHGGLARMLGVEQATLTPARVAPGLFMAAVEPDTALGDYVHDILPLSLFARRLLESETFQIVAAAAPGLVEFLVLQRLARWLRERRLGRARWDLVVVDAPASGHSLPLLTAPRTLRALASVGPIANSLARIDATLRDAETTSIWIVTTPEELPITETIELYGELRDRFGLPVSAPIMNAMPARRFSARDEALLATIDDASPLLLAAHLCIARRQEALVQSRTLRGRLHRAPVTLPLIEGGSDDARLDRLSATIASATGLRT